jgi:MFS family permease
VTAGVLSPADRRELQRRVLRALAASQVIGAAALGSAVTVGGFVVQDILGDDTPWAGIATAAVTTGSAFASQWLARVMARRGRRPGLQLGYAAAAVGALVAALGTERSNLLVFVVGLFLYGSGQASNLLARFAAGDLASDTDRASAMSTVVFASTFGAVAGPLLIGPAERAGETWLGFGTYTGPWIVAAVAFAAAAVTTAVRLRPDPLVAIGGTTRQGSEAAGLASPSGGFRAFAGAMSTSRDVRLAVLAMATSHVVMIAVMTMTPVHLRLHGHEGVSPFVVSVHIAGMYAFSPLMGRYADRHGALRALRLGAGLLVAAGITSSLSGDVEQLLFPSLWLLGLGWSAGLIGGSALLTESVADDSRVVVQGWSDLLMSACGGLAGLASGFVRRAVGFHVLATTASVLAAILLVAVLVQASRVRAEVPRLSSPA